MFRNYPLTCLFILATICVDVTLLVGVANDSRIESNSGLLFFVFNYGLPAQLSALAIWSVISHVHRLFRGALLTVAWGLLLLLTWSVIDTQYRREVVAFNFLQILSVLSCCAFLKYFAFIDEFSVFHLEKRETLRISLIEIFGWTIIVAVWAFAARFADFTIVRQAEWLIWILCAIVVPILATAVLFRRSSPPARLLRLVVIYLLTFLFYAIAWNGRLSALAVSMSVTQLTYISAWWAMMRMDEAMQERRAIIAASREKLALYDPNES